jgi:alanine racemase
MKTTEDHWFTNPKRRLVEVDLGHIEHNILEFKKLIPSKTKILAVVKADAYGHGASMCSPTLLASGVDMFGVASVDEGIQLREAGIQAPILVLGTSPDWAFESAIENDLMLSVYSEEHLNVCKDLYKKTGKKAKVHVKVNTGMNRIGIGFDEASVFIGEILQSDFVELKGVFTHFACSEDEAATQLQAERWNKIYERFSSNPDVVFHCSNTAAAIAYENLNFDMVRIGIGIYGLLPDLPCGNHNLPSLRQAMG